MLIVPIDQVQTIFDEQPLRQAPPSTDWESGEVRYEVLQEDDGEID